MKAICYKGMKAIYYKLIQRPNDELLQGDRWDWDSHVCNSLLFFRVYDFWEDTEDDIMIDHPSLKYPLGMKRVGFREYFKVIKSWE